MAGADYTTIIMRNGKLVPFTYGLPLADEYRLGAVKAHFDIERAGREALPPKDIEDWYINDSDRNVAKTCWSAKDIFREDSWPVFGLMFQDGTTAVIAPENPAYDYAGIAYILKGDSLEIILTGKNDNGNPWLHVLQPGLTVATQDELAGILWQEVTGTCLFEKMFGEHAHFGSIPWRKEEERITAEPFTRLYRHLGGKEE